MKKLIYAMLGLMVIGFTSCKNDEEIIEPKEVLPTVSSLNINIDHTMGAEAMKYNESVVLPSMENVQISRLSYILGNFYLVDANDNKVELENQYALIEAHKGATSLTLNEVPFGEYKSIGFSIGLDSSTNHGNPNQYPADHPLAPINNSLHWSWTGGYIFTALEGKTLNDNESFVFHLAGAQNRLDFEMDGPFTTSERDATKQATLTYDINEIFQNPAVFNIAKDGTSSHSTTSPVAIKLIGNMSDVFTKFEIK